MFKIQKLSDISNIVLKEYEKKREELMSNASDAIAPLTFNHKNLKEIWSRTEFLEDEYVDLVAIETLLFKNIQSVSIAIPVGEYSLGTDQKNPNSIPEMNMYAIAKICVWEVSSGFLISINWHTEHIRYWTLDNHASRSIRIKYNDLSMKEESPESILAWKTKIEELGLPVPGDLLETQWFFCFSPAKLVLMKTDLSGRKVVLTNVGVLPCCSSNHDIAKKFRGKTTINGGGYVLWGYYENREVIFEIKSSILEIIATGKSTGEILDILDLAGLDISSFPVYPKKNVKTNFLHKLKGVLALFKKDRSNSTQNNEEDFLTAREAEYSAIMSQEIISQAVVLNLKKGTFT